MFLTIADWKILDTTVKSRFIEGVSFIEWETKILLFDFAYTTYVIYLPLKSSLNRDSTVLELQLNLLFDISDRTQLRAITFEKGDIEKLGDCGADGVDWFAGPSAVKCQDIWAS